MSTSILKLQDPHDPDSVYLLETLLERFVSAREAGGAFAWATAQGVRLLLGDRVFKRFAEKYSFDLVLGVDAITTPAALEELQELADELDGLSVRIFHSPTDAALFHPKFAWFGEPDGGTAVVGSGNLTNGGLRQNWEAYSVTPLRAPDLEDLTTQWAAWKKTHAARLFPVSAPEVQQQAEFNEAQWKSRKRPKQEPAGPELDLELDALIAEIPRSGNRWEQANFDKESYEDFFGAKIGTQRRMLFQHVAADGTLGAVESRPSVEVKSRNWRFELSAASGLAYPADGRPIGVFLKIRQRTFVYSLIMPDEQGKEHEALTGYLDENWQGRKGGVRRLTASVADVENIQTVKTLLTASRRAFLDEELD